MPKSTSQLMIDQPPHSIRYLYDKHGGMLLGYIFEVVKDRKLAEDYLVKIFSALSLRDEVPDQEQISTWCSLLKFAKAKLQLFQAINPNETAHVQTGVTFASPANTYLDRLNELQRSVFCGVYHHGKTISALSTALNTTEDLTRKTLKEAFLMMRSDG